MTEDREAEFTRLEVRRDALAAEFDAVKRDHEAGLIPYSDALARHKAISAAMRAVANEARALVPGKSNSTPPISN